MVILRDGLIAFLSAVGLASLVWLAAGFALRFHRPVVPGLLLALPVRDDAPALEADLRELRRLQSQVIGGQIVLVDCGMTAEARALAEYLTGREGDTSVVDEKDFRVL